MTGHFFTNLNLQKLILERRPKVIVECGAGEGECTKLLIHLQRMYPFELSVISDKSLGMQKEVTFYTGISYEVLKEFADNSIGMCIIDTDHNYWTLTQELLAVMPKMEEGGLVVMHDVETFYHDTGMGMSYWNEVPYPEEEIKKCVPMGGLGDALVDFLHHYRGTFKLLHWTPEHHGCAVIEKKTVSTTRVVMPGTQPVFAKPMAVA